MVKQRFYLNPQVEIKVLRGSQKKGMEKWLVSAPLKGRPLRHTQMEGRGLPQLWRQLNLVNHNPTLLKKNIPKGIFNQLVSSGVLVSKRQFSEKVSMPKPLFKGLPPFFSEKTLAQYKSQLKTRHHTVIRGFFPPTLIKGLRVYYKKRIKNGFVQYGDSRVPTRYVEYNEPVSRLLQKRYSGLISTLAKKQFKPSFTYFISYEGGSTLPPHTDRKECEFTISVLLGQQPWVKSNKELWPLYFMYPEKWKRKKRVVLRPGDAVLYCGCRLVHWRESLPKNQKSTSLLFHYMPRVPRVPR